MTSTNTAPAASSGMELRPVGDIEQGKSTVKTPWCPAGTGSKVALAALVKTALVTGTGTVLSGVTYKSNGSKTALGAVIILSVASAALAVVLLLYKKIFPMKTFEEDNEALKAEVKALNSEIPQLKAENGKLSVERSAWDAKRTELEKDFKTQQDNIAAFKVTNEALTKQMQGATDKLASSADKLSQVTALYTKYKELSLRLGVQISTAASQNAELSKGNEKLSGTVAKSTELAATVSAQIAQLGKEEGNYESENKQLSTTMASLGEQLNQNDVLLKQIRQGWEEFTQKLQQEKVLDDNLKQRHAEIVESEKRLESLQKQYQELVPQVQKLVDLMPNLAPMLQQMAADKKV